MVEKKPTDASKKDKDEKKKAVSSKVEKVSQGNGITRYTIAGSTFDLPD